MVSKKTEEEEEESIGLYSVINSKRCMLNTCHYFDVIKYVF